MQITSKLQAQARRADGHWYGLKNAVDVSAEAGAAILSGPHGQPVPVLGHFRVINLETGKVVAESPETGQVPELATLSMDDGPVYEHEEHP